jgi:hypothetical protein
MSYGIAPCCLALAVLAAPAAASEPVQLEWNLRLRHESVDDAAFAHHANAETLRLRAGIRAAFGRGWSFLLEGEGIASAGNDYNSGANGRSDWPAITDPSGAEINQAWLGWRGKQAAATIGRQRITLDNQRFIGNSGWRQNEQTFDALSLEFTPIADLTLRYSWLDRVHRVNGDDALDPLARERELSTHLFNVALKHGAQQWVGYTYLHEDRDVAAASTATYGVRWTGSHPGKPITWGWSAEFARQRDYADNPLDFAHSYLLLEPSLQAHGITWKLGWEHLGGNGHHALQTPLATLHAFNGWADKFTVTPANGLEDVYLSASAKAGKATWTVAAHDYRADEGSQHYGHEWDLSVAAPLCKGLTGMIKFADYSADDFARDTRKIWLQLEYSGSQSL